MRLFLALNPSDELRAAVARATASARLAAPALQWVHESLLHLTVKFIGERPSDDCARIAKIVEPIVRESRPFDAVLASAGAFPNFRAPRVVWIGMQNARPLESLALQVDVALAAALDLPREERPFRAHLTLARVKRPLRSEERAALERELRGIRDAWTLPVHRIDLMQSELSRTGPRYSTVASFMLGGP